MQNIFTTLWTIWFHRNMVFHEGKQPNPMEVILMAQTLSLAGTKRSSSVNLVHILDIAGQAMNLTQSLDSGSSWLKLQGLEAQGSIGVLGLMKQKISKELSNFVVWLVAK